MAKHTVHVTVTYSVEVEAKTPAQAERVARLMPEDKMNEFSRYAEVFETYPDPVVKKGRGSY